MKESYNSNSPRELEEYQQPNVKLGVYGNELPVGDFTPGEDQSYFDKRMNADGEYFNRHPELLSQEYELIKSELKVKSGTVDSAKLQRVFELYGSSLQKALEYSIYNTGVYWHPKSGRIMRGGSEEREAEKLQKRFVTVIQRILQQYPADVLLDPEFGRSASGFVELNQLVDAVTHGKELAEHPEYRRNKFATALKRWTRTGLAMLGLGAVSQDALADPVSVGDREHARAHKDIPTLTVSPTVQMGGYNIDTEGGGNDGPEGGPGDDLVELLKGVREMKAVYTTSAEAQDAVDAITARLTKIGQFQTAQAKYLKRNTEDATRLQTFETNLEAALTKAQDEVTRLQTDEANAKVAASAPKPPPAVPGIKSQIAEAKTMAIVDEMATLQSDLSSLQVQWRAAKSKTDRDAIQTQIDALQNRMATLETQVVTASDSTTVTPAEIAVFNAKNKLDAQRKQAADNQAQADVLARADLATRIDSLINEPLGDVSYTDEKSALAVAQKTRTKIAKLRALMYSGTTTAQDDALRDEWEQLNIIQMQAEAAAVEYRQVASETRTGAMQLAKTKTRRATGVADAETNRAIAAEKNAGELEDAQSRVASSQALEGFNSMPKFSKENAEDAERAADAAEDVYRATDAHVDIAESKADIAKQNRLMELYTKKNKTKEELAELSRLEAGQLTPLQKKIIDIYTSEEYEDLSRKEKEALVRKLQEADASSGAAFPPGVYPGSTTGYNFISGQPNQMPIQTSTSDTLRTNVEQSLKNTVDIVVTGDQSKESVDNRDMSFGQKFARHHRNTANKFEYQFNVGTHEAALAEARLIMQDNEYAIKATWNALFKQYDNLPQDIKDKVKVLTYETGGRQYIVDLFNSANALSELARHGYRFAGEPMGNLHLTTQIDADGNITYLLRKPYDKGWGLYLARPDPSGNAYSGALIDASAGQGSVWDGSCYGQPGPDGLHSHTSSYSKEVIQVNSTVFNTIPPQYIYTAPPAYCPPGYQVVQCGNRYGLVALNFSLQTQWAGGNRRPKTRDVEPVVLDHGSGNTRGRPSGFTPADGSSDGKGRGLNGNNGSSNGKGRRPPGEAPAPVKSKNTSRSGGKGSF